MVFSCYNSDKKIFLKNINDIFLIKNENKLKKFLEEYVKEKHIDFIIADFSV